VVGLHFMNPVPIMEGVEIVVGEKTADDVTELAHTFAEDLEKTTGNPTTSRGSSQIAS